MGLPFRIPRCCLTLGGICLAALLLASCATGPPDGEVPARLMSYNIRYDNPGDGVNRWELRRDRLVGLIRLHEPHFLGVQEALHHQLAWLDGELPEMAWIGVGRDDGEQAGEYSAILYDSTRFELVEDSDSTLWLSLTPGVTGSRGWDAALPRILTFGTFRERESGRRIMVFNTHFDHRGDTARAGSARLIAETVERMAGPEGLPAVVTGDFNATPDSEPYDRLTGGGLRDAFTESETPHVGPLFTFEGFEVGGSENPRRIDYIFVNGEVTVRSHAILSTYRDRRYPSDHLPVVADLSF
ncbi:MAG: endonuclease/exonuclease/phosphatase family protein [Balneolaceae bacterium]|nr:endonuclease/exonuclease/phosphatase family protein [Balneolaceae bacterium]